eukprot:tig00000402_g236.t1
MSEQAQAENPEVMAQLKSLLAAAEKRADEAEKRAHEAENRADEAEKRADEAKKGRMRRSSCHNKRWTRKSELRNGKGPYWLVQRAAVSLWSAVLHWVSAPL